MTSGAIQNIVPCIAVEAPKPPMSSVLLEIPKSDILQIPDVSTKILSALRSCRAYQIGSYNGTAIDTYSMQDAFGMEIFQAGEYLFGKRLGDLFVKFTVLQ